MSSLSLQVSPHCNYSPQRFLQSPLSRSAGQYVMHAGTCMRFDDHDSLLFHYHMYEGYFGFVNGWNHHEFCNVYVQSPRGCMCIA